MKKIEMENNRFYCTTDDMLYLCKDVDTDNIIIEYGFKIGKINDISNLEDLCLYYVKNDNIYCCSWFGNKRPVNIEEKICNL